MCPLASFKNLRSFLSPCFRSSTGVKQNNYFDLHEATGVYNLPPPSVVCSNILLPNSQLPILPAFSPPSTSTMPFGTPVQQVVQNRALGFQLKIYIAPGKLLCFIHFWTVLV